MTYQKPKPRPEPEPRHDVEVGDHLYVHHRGQPRTGLVKAHGKHGVTVEIDGGHHPVRWDKVLGHKTRALQKYAVVDQGEDGMLVEDKSGRRRFVAIPNESKEDPMVAKSMGHTRPVMLFMKASAPGTYAGAPGLQKKVITDKNGVQTTKWVSTDQGSPPAQRGQHVGFANGEHKGHGEVTASGKDGVRVRDSAGGQHLVTHDKITHHWGGEGKPDASPHQETQPNQVDAPGTPKPAPDGAEGIARALFDTSELDKLPTKVNQPVQSWDELKSKGEEGLKQYSDMLSKVAQNLGLVTGKRPQSLDHAQHEEKINAEKEGRNPADLSDTDYMLPEHWDDDRGYLFMGPLKGEKRAKEKVAQDYDGDWSQLRDMVRATIAVPGVTQIPKVLAELKAAGIELAQKPKNNLVKPLPGGYRDINMIMRLPNGMLAEMQVHVKPMTLAKEKGHKPYETTRSIEGKYRENGVGSDTSKWDAKDRETHAAAMKEQESLYGDAWEKAKAGEKQQQNESSNLTKSMPTPRMILWNLKGRENGN